MMPWALLVGEGIDDPEKALESFLERGHARPVEGGWLVELDEDDDPKRLRNRARQARFRARKRNASNAENDDSRNARNAAEDDEFESFGGGNYPHSAPLGPVSEGNRRNVTRVTRNASNADNGVTRNAPDDDGRSEWELGPPLTPAERKAAQARIREIGDALRARRTDERPTAG